MSYSTALTLCGMSVVLGNSQPKFKNLNILDSIHNPMEWRLWACSIGQLEQRCYTHVTCPTLNNHLSNAASLFTAKTKKKLKNNFPSPKHKSFPTLPLICQCHCCHAPVLLLFIPAPSPLQHPTLLGGISRCFAHHSPTSLHKHLQGAMMSEPWCQTLSMFCCYDKHFKPELFD